MSRFQLGNMTHDTWVSSNGCIDVGLFKFGLAMQMGEVLVVVYGQPIGQLWAWICMFYCMVILHGFQV